MSSVLALSASLGSFDQAQLEHLLRTRQVNPTASLTDLLDLATLLLRPDSIRRVLSTTPRPELLALRNHECSSAPERTSLAANGLIAFTDGETVFFDEVDALLPDLDEAAAHPLPAQIPPTGLSHVWAERAFETVRYAEQLLRLVTSEPLSAQRNQQPTASTLKRAGQAIAVDSDTVASVLRLLLKTGLVAVRQQKFEPTPEVASWLQLPRASRYVTLISRWLDRMDASSRTILNAYVSSQHRSFAALVNAVFPLATPELSNDLSESITDCALFGILDATVLSELAGKILQGDQDAATDLAERSFPSSVRNVYLQPDLSVIAPGPLAPEIEQELLRFAMIESAGLASSYRITPRSLENALDDGLTADEIRSTLEAISLTGIPQPLQYLINEAESKHRTILLRPWQNGSLLTFAEHRTAEQVRVDSTLTALRLQTHSENELVSAFAPEQILDALRESGYPASLDKSAVTASPAPTAESGTQQTNPDPLAELAARLLTAASSHPTTNSMQRMIELAVKQKQRLKVVLALGEGTEREFTLRPVSFGNGRLRGVDELVQVERTLPINNLVSVEFVN